QAKDGSFRANSRGIEFPDGSTMEMGAAAAVPNRPDRLHKQEERSGLVPKESSMLALAAQAASPARLFARVFRRAAPALLLPLQLAAQPAGWNDPFPPHQVIDNLYYVGTSQLSSFLITTPEGHILHSSNYESSVPVIKANVEALGFRFEDIRILISG